MQSFHSMSMAFPLWPYLYLLLLPSTWAGPPSTGSLTPALQQVIPTCAQACLETFIAESFPSSTCGPPPDFGCLCTSDSTSGLTVGEGALGCLFSSDCGEINELEAASVYDVCITIENAKPNTHSTLTATIVPAAPTSNVSPASQTSSETRSSTSLSRSSKSLFLSPTASSTISSASVAITSASSSSFHSSSVDNSEPTIPPIGGIIPSTSPTTSSTSSTTSATAAPVSSPAPTLSKPQIAGIVVAGVGAAAIGLGLCFLVFCLRRRRNVVRRHSGSSFGNDKILGSHETTPDMSSIAARDFEYEFRSRQQPPPRQHRSPTRQLRLETPASSSEDGWAHYQKVMAAEHIGLAVGPQIPRSLRDEHSPITPASNRTRNSQLLPDKPTYRLFPPPLRPTPRNSIPNQVIRPPGNSPRPAVPPLGSPFARFAPQHPSSVDTSQAHLQGGRAARASSARASNFDPFTDASNRSPAIVRPLFQESRPRPLPPSTRHEPRNFRVPSWEQPPSAGVVRKPVPTYQPYRAQGVGHAPPSNEHHHGAAIENSHRRKSSRRSRASRRETFFSTGSETSFESDDDDEVPDPRSALSPVTEVRAPPGGRVSYPAIPVSASESPTRRARERPVYPAQPDSLLSKRLGQDKAKEIAGRLRGPRRASDEDDVPHSAKWKILVSPGLRGIDKSETPPSAVKSPPTPWRR